MKTKPLQVPRLVAAATVFAELATALKSGTLQGIAEHNEATGLFDRLMPRDPVSGLRGYSNLRELDDILMSIGDYLQMVRRISGAAAPSSTIERAKSLRKASRAKA